MRYDSDYFKLRWLYYLEIPFCIFMINLGMVTTEMHEILIERWNRINQKARLNQLKRM